MTCTNQPTRIILPLAALALIVTATYSLAGPLNPPAGPVTSTGKTLTEVEPRIAINATNTPGTATAAFRITQPGSYYLTGNVGALSSSGIEIAANNVTIDLMGFNIQALFGAVKGITVDALHNNITIRNGTVTGFSQGGIVLTGGSSTTGVLVEHVHASGNAGVGIRVGGHAVIRSCTATSNGAGGIHTDGNSTITGCTASKNTTFGFATGDGCSISGCSADGNTAQGFVTNDATTLTGCASIGNGGSGYQLSSGVSVTGCTATANTLQGFVFSLGSSFYGCTSSSNGGSGFSSNNDATLTSCSATGNSNGFELGQGMTVVNCSAASNTIHGIIVSGASTVTGCTSRFNDLDGIRCSSGCSIRDNTCNFNGDNGAGIHAVGSDNRVEDNNCAGADRGIAVDLPGNIIIRNTCSGNTTDWVFAANNVFGPIIDRRAPASAAVNGFTAPSSFGSTDPNANFSY